MTATLASNLIRSFGEWSQNTLHSLSESIPEFSPRTVSAFGQWIQSVVFGVRIGGALVRSEIIHQQAERENPYRSRLRKCLTHPYHRYLFSIPLVAYGIFNLYNFFAEGKGGEDVDFQETLIEHSKNNPTIYQTVYAISLLPALSDCYEISKRSLKSLWDTYRDVHSIFMDKITDSVPALVNLAFETGNVIRAFSGFNAEWYFSSDPIFKYILDTKPHSRVEIQNAIKKDKEWNQEVEERWKLIKKATKNLKTIPLKINPNQINLDPFITNVTNASTSLRS